MTTNYERYFGTPERAYDTFRQFYDGNDSSDVAIALLYCGDCQGKRCGGECDGDCDRHRIEWLESEVE